MKRVAIISFFLFLVCKAHAGRYELVSSIGPVYISSTAAGQPTITIAAPAAGQKNCLTSLVVTSTNAFTPSVFDGSTEMFHTGTTAAAGNFVKEWPVDDPLCASAAATLVLKSTATAAGNTTMYFSYQGFVAR